MHVPLHTRKIYSRTKPTSFLQSVIVDNVTGGHLVLVAVLGGAVAYVEGVVERDLVPVRHDLVDGRVVQRGRQVAQQRGQALRGVQDVA